MADDDKLPTLYAVKNEVEKFDARIKRDSDEFKTALVVFSVLFFGTKVRAIARFTKLGRKFVRIRAERLRKNGIWCEDHKWRMDWYDDEKKEVNTVSFWLDVLVATGALFRTSEGKFGLAEWNAGVAQR